MRLLSCIGPLVYLSIAVSALAACEPRAQEALVLNDKAAVDAVHSGMTKENVVVMGDPEEGDPDPDDPDDVCFIGDEAHGELHADNFACGMTSKLGKNCNIGACKAGGGLCYMKKGKCCGKKMSKSKHNPIECYTNCRCKLW